MPGGSKEREVLLCVLDMYKDMPYLWKKDHKHYLNKHMRAEGFKDLLEIYKNFDENATVKTLKKKIDNLRTCYAKESRKVLALSHSGAEEEYVPTLWYFNALSFLGPKTDSCRIVTRFVSESSENVNSSTDEETPTVATTSSGQQKIKIKDPLFQKEKHIFVSPNTSKTEITESQKINKEEDWEVYGRAIGLQMKDLSKRQMIITQKIISDVIFYAKLDKLSECSRVVLSPSSEPKSNLI